ncbi:ARM repeat-containing protein [Aureobasidium namibiae CBS 147.97]|uniref:ARM repeat-containing protein n=1 Tax=Aureobasidium namibiae CBS 147.97 TaxID=1043004 RepID=A0A074X3W8_9PEZI
MVQPPSLAALHELKTSPQPSTNQQLRLLRTIKNDIVGHGQRKKLVVRYGLLDCLAHTLATSPDADIQLQTSLIVASLAEEGAAFVAPILSSNLVQPLLLFLSSVTPSPVNLVTASLRAVNALAASWVLSPNPDPVFVKHVFNKHTLASLLNILRHPLPTSIQQQHIALTSTLLATCCGHAHHLAPTLVQHGILDALASNLASFALAHHRSAHSICNKLDATALINAVSSIVRDSTYRAHRLIFSDDLRRIFSQSSNATPSDPLHTPDFSHHQYRKSAHVVPVDALLPKVMVPLQKSLAFGHHALINSRLFSDHSATNVSVNSPICVWLMYLARSQQDPSCRLAALRLLAILNDALDADIAAPRSDTLTRSRERERQMALFAIPIAVKLVQDSLDTSFGQDLSVVKEDACAVLAHLIENSTELQQAALDAGAVKHVSQLFRKSFDPITLARPMWSADSHAADSQLPPSLSATLGPDGLAPEVMHVMKCRAGALDALAAIAEKEDVNRKAVIDSGIISSLIDSLAPISAFDSSTTPSKNGNTVPVLLAACHAATALSRSVSLLRTALIDAGITKPIYALLAFPDIEVQIAATNVICNLVLEFSPMRQDLVVAGVVTALCEQAKRSNFKLRQASLWALKHLVLNSPKDMKVECLEQLGTGWLIQAVNGTPLPGHSMTLGSSNAAGEQVDLLNASDMMDGEVLMDHNGTRYQSSGLRTTLDTTNHKAHLRLLRKNEHDPTIQAKHDDMLVQEQALDFIRNLINGDDNVAMIEHLNSVLGADRLFEMLHNKLRPVVYRPNSPLDAQRDTPPELINAALGVIIHVAGGSSKHRQQLIAQTPLLTAWLPHFSHTDRRIRVASVWAIINLTWVDSAADREDAKARARTLASFGIDEKVRALAEDVDADTRERVKTAVRQIDELLEGGRYR